MSFLTRIIPNVLQTAQKITSSLIQNRSGFHSLTSDTASSISPGGLFSISTRNTIRCHFPRPSERKRIKRHGFKQRMSTPAGRRILMNRILKGRFVYSH